MRSSHFFAAVLCSCGGPPPAMPPPPSNTCLQVLQCIVACAETDERCQKLCLDQGSALAQQQTIDLASCLDTSGCSDADCAQAKCGQPLSACLGGSVPAGNPGTPLTSEAPPGRVPPELVGSWAGARYGQTQRLVFNADGTGRWESSTTSTYYACLYVATAVQSGTVVIDETAITLYASTVEDRIHDCRGPDEVTPKPAVTSRIEYLRSSDPNELLIVDEACAAKYPEGRNCTMYAGCPIGLYCTSRVRRE